MVGARGSHGAAVLGGRSIGGPDLRRAGLNRPLPQELKGSSHSILQGSVSEMLGECRGTPGLFASAAKSA